LSEKEVKVISGIGGMGTSFYLAQMRRAASNAASAAGFSQTDVSKSQSQSKSQVSMEEIFSKIDTDGDGVISKNEFDKAKSNVQGKITDTLAGAQSSASTSSLLSLLEASAKLSSSSTSGSGGVQSQIADIASDQVFSKLDTNGDGVVSKDEMTSVLSGAGGAAGASSNKETIAGSIAAQTNALMTQVINRYTQLAQSTPTAGAMSSLFMTG
jgi:Ca2+-binding EF-hand superfamily protein